VGRAQTLLFVTFFRVRELESLGGIEGIMEIICLSLVNLE
jgi:hypothetical protein